MAEKIALELDVDSSGVEKGGNSVKSLRAQLKDATMAAQELGEKFGNTSIQAINAAKKAAELKEEISDMKDTINALSPEAKFNAIASLASGIAGGFSAAQGAMALFGGESEQVQKQLLKVQAALAISQGLNSILGLKDAFSNLGIVLKSTAAGQAILTAAQTAYSFVVGAGSLALKVFRGALISTGIGAVIVLIGMLIANFDLVSQWVMKVVEKFSFLRNILESLGVVADSQEKLVESTKKNVEASEELAKAKQREIDLAKAQGASAKQLRDMEIQMNADKFESYRKYVAAKMKAGQEVTQDEKNQLADLRNAYQISMSDNIRLTQEEEKKKADERQKAYDKAKQDRLKRIQEQQALEKQLQDERIAGIKDSYEKELAQANANFERKINAIKGNSSTEIKLREQLEQNKQAAIEAIKEKYAKEKLQKAAEAEQKKFQDNQAKLQAELIQLENQNKATFAKERQIENANYQQLKQQKGLTNNQLELIEAQHQQKMLDIDKKEGQEAVQTQKQISQAKMQAYQGALNGISSLLSAFAATQAQGSKAQKDLALAGILVDEARTIAGVVANATEAAEAGGPAAPFLMAGYIAEGLATAIPPITQAKQLLGSSASTSTTTSSSPSVQSPAVAAATTNSSVTSLTAQKNKQDKPQQVVVSEYDITRTQKRITGIQERASFS